MTNELKPCPFCGCSNISTYRRSGSDCAFIWCECDLCGATTKAVRAIDCDADVFWETNSYNKKMAKERWNCRYDENISDRIKYLTRHMIDIKKQLLEIERQKRYEGKSLISFFSIKRFENLPPEILFRFILQILLAIFTYPDYNIHDRCGNSKVGKSVLIWNS